MFTDATAAAQNAWVKGRQHTGRIVTVTNDKIFDEPVYNSTRGFPFLWEEVTVPITYATNRQRAEGLLIDAAQRVTADTQKEAEPYRDRMRDLFQIELEPFAPRVFLRITDNWLELSLRFLVREKETRDVKDRIARAILDGFDQHGIGIASMTIDIVAFPPLRRAPAPQPETHARPA